jgi:hypothetical protein
MINPELNQPLVEAMRIQALQRNVDALRGQPINGDMVNSLFRSAKVLAKEVMGATPLAASVFAMRFGSVILTCATFKDLAEVQHGDGSVTEVPLNSPATMSRSMARYLYEHCNPYSGRKRRDQLFFEIRDRVTHAGVATDFLDRISSYAADTATEVWDDESRFSSQYFQRTRDRVRVQPHFSMLEGSDYERFLEETGTWVENRFSEVVDSALTGRYLMDQEMQY